MFWGFHIQGDTGKLANKARRPDSSGTIQKNVGLAFSILQHPAIKTMGGVQQTAMLFNLLNCAIEPENGEEHHLCNGDCTLFLLRRLFRWNIEGDDPGTDCNRP